MSQERVVTHYDNLKVARNAPTEVIRAAYRALAQQFHPDKFPDRTLAEHRMKVINKAYEVLSDPDKRSAHDQWIIEQEALKLAMENQRGSVSAQKLRPEASASTSASVSSGIHKPHLDDGARFRHDIARSATAYIPRHNHYAYRAGLTLRKWWLAVEAFVRQVLRGAVYLLIGAAAVGLLISWAKESPNLVAQKLDRLMRSVGAERRVDTGRYSEAAWTKIQPNELTINYPQYDLATNVFSGRVVNNSQHRLRDFTLNIEVVDCTPSCVVVANRVVTVHDVEVPSGQSRDFRSGGKLTDEMISLGNTAPVIRGKGQYQWKIIGTIADL